MDKELIEHITSQLQNHEEQYSNGAWERFSEKEEKKRGIHFWPVWAAAALILIFGGVFFALNTNNQKNNIVANKTKTQQKEKQTTTGIDKNTDLITKNDAVSTSKVDIIKANELAMAKSVVNGTNSKISTVVQTGYIIANAFQEKVLPSTNMLDNSMKNIALSNSNYVPKDFDIWREKKQAQPIKKTTFEELLAHDSRADQGLAASKTNQPSKWQPDVYVAPAMGNDNKVNMNYGFSLSYAIANKLAISSGVSYASISTTESLNASAPQTLTGRNLASVDAKVRGINIPLELKYNISDKLYTGIGVSALAVLNNSQENNYIVNQVQNVSYSSANGIADQKMLIVQEKTTEPQPETNIDPDKYIGFYNFSLGYKQKISKKNNIAIEPFLRLPMKSFSKENLNLTNGGLRLKIDF
ncbi:hypothetical protein ACS5PU_21665 [Pedobacter sp. GSP4]|uniref:hypothetical protein n=1 Tax=Pedobacter sp. GSP4 TaxID=3453716 RepID=UPI003EE90C7D